MSTSSSSSVTKWSWEDEMLLYDLSHRDHVAKKRRLESETKKEKKLRAEDSTNEEQTRLDEHQSKIAVDERKLFVGGLTPTTVEKTLSLYFSEFGLLQDVQVMRDRESGKSRCFAFVLFTCSFMVDAVLERENHVIDDKPVSIRRALSKSKSKKKSKRELDVQRDSECKHKRSIFVAPLSEHITQEHLRSYFSNFGQVLRAVKLSNTSSAPSKRSGYGFVDFRDFGVVRNVVSVSKHYIEGNRVRVDVSRPRIEFSHQTKTVFVGGLEDGIDDTELHKCFATYLILDPLTIDPMYFSEFGFVTRALRIPNKDGPKRKFGFVDFDDFESVDLVMSQPEHAIDKHILRVELALPMVEDSMYEIQGMPEANESWMQKVQRKLQYAVPEQGRWGDTVDNYTVFVSNCEEVKTLQFKLDRSLIQFVVGMAGKVVESIANDTNTRIVLHKPAKGSKKAVFDVTGKKDDVNAAQFIFQQIVKSNINKVNVVKIDRERDTGKNSLSKQSEKQV